MPNPSIGRTNNGWQTCAVWREVRGPLFAAHVERYASSPLARHQKPQ